MNLSHSRTSTLPAHLTERRTGFLGVTTGVVTERPFGLHGGDSTFMLGPLFPLGYFCLLTQAKTVKNLGPDTKSGKASAQLVSSALEVEPEDTSELFAKDQGLSRVTSLSYSFFDICGNLHLLPRSFSQLHSPAR